MKRIASLFMSLCLGLGLIACGPGSPQEMQVQAFEKAEAGDIEGAIADLEVLKASDLDDQQWGEVVLQLGTIRLQGGDLEGARRDLRDVVERVGVQNLNPALEQMGQLAAWGVIRSYIEAGQFEQALEEVEATSSTLVNGGEFGIRLVAMKATLLGNMMNRPEEAVDLMMHLAADGGFEPVFQLQLLSDASQFFIQNEMYSQAAQVYVDYLEANPDFELPVDIYARAGTTYALAESLTPEQEQEQRALMRKVLELADERLTQGEEEDRARVLFNKAMALRFLERETEAQDLWTSITRNQSFPEEARFSAYQQLAAIERDRGNYAEARQILQQLMEDVPSAAQWAQLAISDVQRQESEAAIRGGDGAQTQPATQPSATAPAATEPAATAPAAVSPLGD